MDPVVPLMEPSEKTTNNPTQNNTNNPPCQQSQQPPYVHVGWSAAPIESRRAMGAGA